MNWLTSLPVQIQAALIAALVTVLGVFARDFGLTWIKEARQARRSAAAVYMRYAEPLAAAASSLLWRLHEVFLSEGRGVFLRADHQGSEYEKYKHVSTVYRLACVLGWIRAIRCELSSLEGKSGRPGGPVEPAIAAFVSSLADGPHIEVRRLKELAALWALPLPDDPKELSSLAVVLETEIKRGLTAAGAASARELPPPAHGTLCRAAADAVASRLRVSAVSQAVLDETLAKAIQSIGIREAWIYRDWQAAIGDLVIRRGQHGDRTFDVIGFGEFESMLLTGSDDQKRWLDRLGRLFDDVDVSGVDLFDARVAQLREVLKATAGLLEALAESRPHSHLVSAETLGAAAQARNALAGSGH